MKHSFLIRLAVFLASGGAYIELCKSAINQIFSHQQKGMDLQLESILCLIFIKNSGHTTYCGPPFFLFIKICQYISKHTDES
jgi:hypothetical protein